jgi:hypothetical protein
VGAPIIERLTLNIEAGLRSGRPSQQMMQVR